MKSQHHFETLKIIELFFICFQESQSKQNDSNVAVISHDDINIGTDTPNVNEVQIESAENNENNLNAVNLLGKPFIPFKIRGRRPSESLTTRMPSIFEE